MPKYVRHNISLPRTILKPIHVQLAALTAAPEQKNPARRPSPEGGGAGADGALVVKLVDLEVHAAGVVVVGV